MVEEDALSHDGEVNDREASLSQLQFMHSNVLKILLKMPMPAYCPGEGCFDKFPLNPSLRMRHMIKHYREILSET